MAAAIKAERASAFHFCGHIYTTGSCPHPSGLPRVDANGFPLRASDGKPVDDLGRRVDRAGRPLDARGRLLLDPDGRPLPPASRTRICDAAAARYRVSRARRRFLVSVLRRARPQGRRLLWLRPSKDQRRRRPDGATATPAARSSASSTSTPRSGAERCSRHHGATRRARERLVTLKPVDGLHRRCGSQVRREGRQSPAGGASFAVGLLAGSMLVFGSLGVVATLLHPGRAWILVAAAIAAAAALSDAGGLRVRPQIPFQVPEHWRRTMPLPLAVFLYGLLIGTGLTTYVPAAAAWALMVLSLALGKLVPALAVGLLLAAGRALPVLVLICRSHSASAAGARRNAGGAAGGTAPRPRAVCRLARGRDCGCGCRDRRRTRHRALGRRPERRRRRSRLAAPRSWAAFSAAPARHRYGSPATTRRLAARSSPGTSAPWSPSPTAARSRRSSRKLPRGSRNLPSPSTGSPTGEVWPMASTRLVVQSLPDLGAGRDGCLGSLAVHARPTVPLRQHRGLPRRDAARELDLGRRSGYREAPAPS